MLRPNARRPGSLSSRETCATPIDGRSAGAEHSRATSISMRLPASPPTTATRIGCSACGTRCASLPESQRRALILREWHGVPSQEIAAQLHLSAPATHALLSRARRSLARALTVPRPAAGFDLSWLLSKLETPLRLLGTGMSKATAVTVAAGVIAGGIALERETSSPSRADRVPVPVVRPTAQSASKSAPAAARPAERSPSQRRRAPRGDEPDRARAHEHGQWARRARGRSERGSRRRLAAAAANGTPGGRRSGSGARSTHRASSDPRAPIRSRARGTGDRADGSASPTPAPTASGPARRASGRPSAARNGSADSLSGATRRPARRWALRPPRRTRPRSS